MWLATHPNRLRAIAQKQECPELFARRTQSVLLASQIEPHRTPKYRRACRQVCQWPVRDSYRLGFREPFPTRMPPESSENLEVLRRHAPFRVLLPNQNPGLSRFHHLRV